MKIAPSSAATNASALKWPPPRASEVPTSTGATAAGSVRTRAAITQIRTALGVPAWLGVVGGLSRVVAISSGSPGEAGEVGSALLLVGIATLLCLLAHVEEQVGVVGELLYAGETILGGVEAGLQEAQREGGEGQHLPAPLHRLLLQALQWDHGV